MSSTTGCSRPACAACGSQAEWNPLGRYYAVRSRFAHSWTEVFLDGRWQTLDATPPNLTSVERLSRFFEDDKNYFVVLMVAYNIQDLHAVIERVTFVPIEFLGWDCLTIGALGWGQIQIANSNRITINPQYSRKSWMIEFCDTMLEFYSKEIAKIDTRIERFRKIREEWERRPE